MTLARRTPDGTIWISGVFCRECGRDTLINNTTGKCLYGHLSPYKPVGTVVKVAK